MRRTEPFQALLREGEGIVSDRIDATAVRKVYVLAGLPKK
jgi:hypothetical protein